MRTKEEQLSVIKFLKSPAYQEVLKKYEQKYDAKMAQFQAKYEWEDSDKYKSNEPIYSELAMQTRKLKIFKEKIEDVKGNSEWAVLLREILEEQAKNISSHLYNTVTNSFGWSKDIGCFTEDDIEKFKMLHMKDFHIFIVGIMNSGNNDEELSLSSKYEIYENPEDQL